MNGMGSDNGHVVAERGYVELGNRARNRCFNTCFAS